MDADADTELLGQIIHHGGGELPIRRGEEFRETEGRLVIHRTQFRESNEAFTAVVMAHAAGTNPTEWHVMLRDMKQGVVD